LQRDQQIGAGIRQLAADDDKFGIEDVQQAGDGRAQLANGFRDEPPPPDRRLSLMA